jgi:hypothetical protein
VGARCGAVHVVFDSHVDLHVAYLEPEATPPTSAAGLGTSRRPSRPQ